MSVLLKDEDVMEMLSIKDKRTLKKYRSSQGLDFIRVGHTYRYTQKMIEDFLFRRSSLSIIRPLKK